MMRRWLARHILFPAADRLAGRDSLAYWRKLEAMQYWSSDQLRELQNTKLKKLLSHAVAQSPF